MDQILALMIARTAYFDEKLLEYTLTSSSSTNSNGVVGQVVLLGAGFDTRVHRLPASPSQRWIWFEVDAPNIQEFKQQALANLRLPDGTTHNGTKNGTSSNGKKAASTSAAASIYNKPVYVPVVFEKDNWVTCLTAKGFDPKIPSVFVMEGVINYLDSETASATLRAISKLGGSLLLTCMRTTRPDAASVDDTLKLKGEQRLKSIGEPHRFILPHGGHEQFFQQHGFEIAELLTETDMTSRYVPPTLTENLPPLSAFGVPYNLFHLRPIASK